MIILVDGQEAILSDDFSFEYIVENRLFLGRDGYTLNITFPLRECAGNIAIFGHLHRADIAKDKIIFECSILDKNTTLNGSLRITKIGEKSIEGQFTEGRCEQTSSDPFEDTYVNELDLGVPAFQGDYTPAEAWKSIDDGKIAVALPWINEASPTQFNNWVVYEDGLYKWDVNVYVNHRPTEDHSMSLKASYLSWQPYLIYIAKKILDKCGYTYDFTAWESSSYRFLIICNTLPYTWTEGDLRDFKNILPRWTVSEFFEKLEKLLLWEFDFDHRAKHVKMSMSKVVLASTPTVEIAQVVDEYSVDIDAEGTSSNCDYIGAKRWAYKECSHPMQMYYACDWFRPGETFLTEYPDTPTLLSLNARHYITLPDGTETQVYGEQIYYFDPQLAGWVGGEYHQFITRDDVDKVMYSDADRAYFVFRSIAVEGRLPGREFDTQIYVPQPINAFGCGIPDSDDIETEEIEFVPVCISDTYISKKDDKGYMMYLSFSSYQDDTTTSTTTEQGTIRQPTPTCKIIDGEKEKTSEYYDVIYLAFWNGVIPEPGKTPYPYIDRFCVTHSVLLRTGSI